MKYHGLTVIVNNKYGAQRIGVDSCYADMLLSHMEADAMELEANDGDVIILKPYIMEVSWFQMMKMRWSKWRKIRQAERRLRDI